MSAEVSVFDASPFPGSAASLLSPWDVIKWHPGACSDSVFAMAGQPFSSFLSLLIDNTLVAPSSRAFTVAVFRGSAFSVLVGHFASPLEPKD